MSLFISADGSDVSGGQHRKLGYFVAGSLVLHLLVAGLWRGEPPAGPVGQSTFKITLLARHGDTESVRAAVIESAVKTGAMISAGSSRNYRKPAASTETHRQQPRAVTKYTVPLQLVTPAAARTGQGSGHRDSGVPGPQGKALDAEGARDADKVVRLVRIQPAASSGSRTHGEHELTSEAKYRRVRAALQTALLPIFEYPRVARRRGWQGRVKVGLYVDAGGDLSRIHLIESSGYSLLDKEAVKNVTSLRNVPAVIQWLDSSGMEVVLPVSYRLDTP
jgi:protein TonB